MKRASLNLDLMKRRLIMWMIKLPGMSFMIRIWSKQLKVKYTHKLKKKETGEMIVQ